MEYYAHTREDGERQTVKAHLTGVIFKDGLMMIK